MVWTYRGGGAPAGTENPVVDGDLTVSGTIKERSRALPMGEWDNFAPVMSAVGGTWTGGTVAVARKALIGTTMIVALDIYGTTVTSTPSQLQILIPNGATAAHNSGCAGAAMDNGTSALAWVLANSTVISIFKNVAGTGTWAASAGATRIGFTIAFEITDA